ncbi:hypothetical protein ACFP1Z_22925 [Streptomyces gamaensis]|uniref:DUF397 domain-containing protein n=1 Tax=Streptomyces gamaensis TaxID=1763542 RepID=A0ABW0Z8U6_9ACTN
MTEQEEETHWCLRCARLSMARTMAIRDGRMRDAFAIEDERQQHVREVCP